MTLAKRISALRREMGLSVGELNDKIVNYPRLKSRASKKDSDMY